MSVALKDEFISFHLHLTDRSSFRSKNPTPRHSLTAGVTRFAQITKFWKCSFHDHFSTRILFNSSSLNRGVYNSIIVTHHDIIRNISKIDLKQRWFVCKKKTLRKGKTLWTLSAAPNEYHSNTRWMCNLCNNNSTSLSGLTYLVSIVLCIDEFQKFVFKIL